MSAKKATQPVVSFTRCLSTGLTAALLGGLASVAQAQNADISAPNTILAVAQQSVQQIEAKKAGDLYAQAPAFVKAPTIVIGFVLAPPVGLEPTTPSLAVPDEKLP